MKLATDAALVGFARAKMMKAREALEIVFVGELRHQVEDRSGRMRVGGRAVLRDRLGDAGLGFWCHCFYLVVEAFERFGFLSTLIGQVADIIGVFSVGTHTFTSCHPTATRISRCFWTRESGFFVGHGRSSQSRIS
ncbi:MAG: hypothetical protein HPM95_11900 [Alphaproteobacteria bacterium]|nr:hypothetical protein [Alphaproteobacteria bacterium]